MRILFAVFLSSLLYSLVEGLPKLNPVVLGNCLASISGCLDKRNSHYAGRYST